MKVYMFDFLCGPKMQGFEAQRNGESAAACPYDADSEDARMWMEGWNEEEVRD